MSVFYSFILGIVQGLTEFLPISSSGHLILAQKLFGLKPDLFINVALHLGTLVAVVVFYKKQVWQIAKKPFGKKGLLVMFATIPTVVIGLLAKTFFPASLDGAILPIGFALTFVLLLLSSLFTKQKHNLLTMPQKNAWIAGIVQGISVLPGLSRSGATICTLKMLGTKDDSATELSFLMSIPVILGSIVLLLFESGFSTAEIDWLCIAVGIATSFAVGYFSLGLLKKIASKGNLDKFAWYMIFPLLLSCVVF